MPKKPKSPNPLVAQETIELRLPQPLSYEERSKLRTLFADPVFVKAWNNAQLGKPSVVLLGLDGQHGLQIGNNRLHELRGWELFRAALLRETMERLPTPTKPTDSYPASGTIEAEAQRQLNQKTK